MRALLTIEIADRLIRRKPGLHTIDARVRYDKYNVQGSIKMTMSSGRIIHPSVLAVLSALAGPLAHAQSTSSGSAMNAAAQSELLEEIVVTAQKRTERLLDVPAAVTALGSEDLLSRGALRFEDYQAYVPGLSTTPTAPGFNQITLRGVTTGTSQLSATVATYFDETPTLSSNSIAFGSKLTPDPDLLDVQRIEVLRGPQGTLYGANALGGVIRYVLVEPELDEFHGRVQAGGFSVAHGEPGYLVRGALDMPLVAGISGMRASGFHTQDGGYVDNVTTGDDDLNRSTNSGGRLAFLWKPNDRLSAALSSLYQRRKNDGNPAETTVDMSTLSPANSEYQQALSADEFLRTEYQLHSLTLNADLGFATLVSATGYGRQETEMQNDVTYAMQPFVGLPAVTSQVPVELKKVTQELRLASPTGGAVEYIVGAYYTRERSSAVNLVQGFVTPGVIASAPLDILIDSAIRSRYQETALFANTTFHFTDRFSLQAGGRWSRNEQEFAQSAGGLFFGPVPMPPLNNDSSETAWTYAVSPQFKVTPDFNLYARIAKGFRPGGANLLPPAQFGSVASSYDSDTLINYELGVKAAAFDRRLNLSLAAFQIDWKDIQTTTLLGTSFAILNGDTARSQGFEAEARWSEGGLALGANFSYTDAETRDAIPQAGAQAGDELPYTPKWAGALIADYEFLLGMQTTATIGGGVRYVGSRQAFYSLATANTPGGLELDDHVLLDLRAALRRGPYELSLYAQNVTDEHAILSVQTDMANPITGAGTRAIIARPRTIGLTVAVDF